MKPKYQQIIDSLKEEINQKKFHTGDKFYSEADIKEMFSVSSTTAVKVLNSLANENIINRIQGKGTFIATEKHNAKIRFTDLNMAKGAIEGTKVISMQEENDPEILKELHLPKNKTYFRIIRLRFINSQISELSISYVNSKYIKGFNPHHLQKFSALYQKIAEDFEIDPFKLPYRQVVTAETVSDQKILKHLQLEKATPLIKQVRHTLFPHESSELLDYVVSYKKLNFWGFKIEVPEQKNVSV